VHSHSHNRNTGRVLSWSMGVTLTFVAVEGIAGIQAHSLALLSDAGHNFTDALALLLAAFAYRLESRPADEEKTFGYHRAGVLAAFVNAATLLALSLFIFRESYQRLVSPPKVHEATMLWVAAAGLVVNLGVMWGLKPDKDRDINVRAAFVHMLGDALGSFGIILGAIAIRYTGWQRIDPALSVLIGLMIIWTAWGILRESLNILLEGLPRGMKLRTVCDAIGAVEGVRDVHDLHVWSLGSSVHALSCHVRIEDLPPSESEAILKRINRRLAAEFHIHHTTIQFEHNSCAAEENDSSLPFSRQGGA
jgi:cobalt-zinc-cadmium efflux system protein